MSKQEKKKCCLRFFFKATVAIDGQFHRYCISYSFAQKGVLWECLCKLATKTVNTRWSLGHSEAVALVAWMSAWLNVTNGKADQLFTSSSDGPLFPLIYLNCDVLLQIKLSIREKESAISVQTLKYFVCFVFTERERKLRANDCEYNLSFKYAVSMKTHFFIHLVQ